MKIRNKNIYLRMITRLKILALIFIASIHSSANRISDPHYITPNPYFLDHARNSLLTPERRLALYDSLLVTATTPYVKAKIIEEKGCLYQWIGNYREAMACYNNAMKIVPSDSLSLRLSLLFDISRTHRREYDYDSAVDAVYEMLDTDKPDSLRYFNILAYRELQGIFDKLQNPAAVTKYLEEARNEYSHIDSILYPTGWRKARQVLYHMEGINSLWDDDMNMAYSCLRKALEDAIDPESRFTCLGNLAFLAQNSGQFDIAGQYFRQCIEMKDEVEPHLYSILTLNYINFYVRQRKFKEARRLMAENAAVLDYLRGGPMEKGIWLNLFEIEKGEGCYKEALAALEKAYSIYYDQVSKDNNKHIAEMSDRLEKRRDKIRHENLSDSLNLRTGIIILLSCLVIVISLLALVYHRKGRRNSERSQSLEVMIEDLGREHREEMRENVEKLDRSSRDLSALAIQMARMSDSHVQISNELADTSVSPEQRIARIERILKQFSREDNLWDMFSTYFEQSNRQFFSRLLTLAPDLTNAEMRMASFMLMGLSTNEIAVMTHRSRRTISNIKYTLRKKLGIDENSELFLHRVNQASDQDFDNIMLTRKKTDEKP